MYRWVSFLVVVVTFTVASIAEAAPAPVIIATCGDSKLAVVAGASGAAGQLHAVVAAAGTRWSFVATVGLTRLGARTRTITVEDIRTQDGKAWRGKDAAPASLFVDLLIDDKKVLLRHAPEGDSDPEYTVDLERCSFGAGSDEAIAALVSGLPGMIESMGCGPSALDSYRTQVAQVAKLPQPDLDREAQALCEDHLKTAAARGRLEQAISDRAARDRITAHGATVMRSEETRMKAWNRVDGCLSGELAKPRGVGALHDAEARTRACYSKIAAKP